jgi:hypothetical protein
MTRRVRREVNHTGTRGLALADMFEVTRRHLPPSDIVRLLDMVVFNILACNTDAHAKNYSILIRGNGVSLAPMYDVMCGEVFDGVTNNLAQRVAGKNRGDHIKVIKDAALGGSLRRRSACARLPWRFLLRHDRLSLFRSTIVFGDATDVAHQAAADGDLAPNVQRGNRVARRTSFQSL